MISGVSSAAVATIQAGFRQLDGAAQTVASAAGSDMARLTEALVSGQQARVQVEAGVKVLETANQALGSLLDAFA